jgi:parafibromin
LGARAASGTGAALVAAAKAKLTSAVPIIVVPSAVTSLLTLHNVKDLFEGNRFVSPQEKLASGVEKRDTVTIMGPSLRQPGRTVPYHVIDDPTKLPRGDWARIVAVFAHGAEWQFKEWQPPYNVPSDLFDRIAGFHLHYDDQQPPQLIQSWNVRRLRVSKTKRHNDTMLVVEFWKLLHERLRTRASAAALDL